MRKNLLKLELYRKFTNSLALFVLLSIAWVGYEVIPFSILSIIEFRLLICPILTGEKNYAFMPFYSK